MESKAIQAEKQQSRRRKNGTPNSTIALEIGATASANDVHHAIFPKVYYMSTDTVKHLIDQCSKHQLYFSLWGMEGRYDLVESKDVPLFIRYLAPNHSTDVYKMIQERIYQLEIEAFIDAGIVF